jgi:hypothetical protein
MSFEERLKEFGKDLNSKIDKSIKELLYGYYPYLTEKEFVICSEIASAVWPSCSIACHYDIIVHNIPDYHKELFHNIDEVETVIKQLIEKGVLKTGYSNTINGREWRCHSPLCPKAFYHIVKYYIFVKEEIECEAFKIYSNHFGASSTEYFGPVEPEEPS